MIDQIANASVLIPEIRSLPNHLLLIPFHFPPVQGSTGAFRSLSFCRWLPENDWRVTVLTVSERAYPDVSESNYELIDPQTSVHRAFALDAKRHLSIGGRYLRLTALPDRWASWVIGGVLSGLKIIRRDAPDAIYTTYPVPSSHLIGLILHKFTGTPWIAEFRDPMVEDNYPANKIEREIRSRIERGVVAHASRIVTVTPSAKNLYEARAENRPEFVVQIENGYDDTLLGRETGRFHNTERADGATLEILHSGILYDDVRNPTNLLLALQELNSEGFFGANPARFVFRGAGSEQQYSKTARDLGIESIVEFRKSVSYADAHKEMHQADALLLMQGNQCNRQIPAKFYEYCALRKPILAIADPCGDTGSLFMHSGLGKSVPLEDPKSIKLQIKSFVRECRENRGIIVSDRVLASMSRRARAKELANLLCQVVNVNKEKAFL